MKVLEVFRNWRVSFPGSRGQAAGRRRFIRPWDDGGLLSRGTTAVYSAVERRGFIEPRDDGGQAVGRRGFIQYQLVDYMPKYGTKTLIRQLYPFNDCI